jgi:virginiamycin B lyase
MVAHLLIRRALGRGISRRNLWATLFISISALVSSCSNASHPAQAVSDESLSIVSEQSTGANQPLDVCTSPQGVIWYTRFSTPGPESRGGDDGHQVLFRLSRLGTESGVRISGPYELLDNLVALNDNSVWFIAHTSRYMEQIRSDRLVHVGKDGRILSLISVKESEKTRGLASAPDGSLWFSQANPNQLGRLLTSGRLEYFPLLQPHLEPTQIGFDARGNVWFVAMVADSIGKLDVARTLTVFRLPSGGRRWPSHIVQGKDGAMWFTEYRGLSIGRIAVSGAIREYSVETEYGYPEYLARAPSGDLWFTTNGEGALWRITELGKISRFSIPGVGLGREIDGLLIDRNGTFLIWYSTGRAGHINRLAVH